VAGRLEELVVAGDEVDVVEVVEHRVRLHQRPLAGLDRGLGHDLEHAVGEAHAERVDAGAPVVGEREHLGRR
jgi:hypothetical protein